jgi:hypothetical protein
MQDEDAELLRRLGRVEGLLEAALRNNFVLVQRGQQQDDHPELDREIAALRKEVGRLSDSIKRRDDRGETRDGGENGGGDPPQNAGSEPPGGNFPEEGRDRGPPRYWENYAVRYVGGTFVGLLAIVTIPIVTQSTAPDSSHQLVEMWKELPFSDAEAAATFLLLGVAFTFSYIASAPIYVLHFLRAYLFDIAEQDQVEEYGAARSTLGGESPFYRLVPLVLVVVATALILLAMLASVVWPDDFPANELARGSAWLVFIFLIAIQLAGIWLVLRRKTGEGNTRDRLHEFYIALAQRRAHARKNQQFVAEYIESYRHLREHGNASLIVIFNILLAVVVSLVTTIQSVALMIAVWSLPAGACWLAATLMERDMLRSTWP